MEVGAAPPVGEPGGAAVEGPVLVGTAPDGAPDVGPRSLRTFDACAAAAPPRPGTESKAAQAWIEAAEPAARAARPTLPPPDAVPVVQVKNFIRTGSATRLRSIIVSPTTMVRGSWASPMSASADAYTSAAAGLYVTRASSQPTTLGSHGRVAPVKEPAAARTTTPDRMTTAPSRKIIKMAWTRPASIINRPSRVTAPGDWTACRLPRATSLSRACPPAACPSTQVENESPARRAAAGPMTPIDDQRAR